MKNSNARPVRFWGLLVTIGVVAAIGNRGGGKASGWEAAAVNNGAESAPLVVPTLTLSVAATKQQYVLGEPVYLLVRLQNIGTNSVAVYSSLDLERGPVQVYVTNPRGKKKSFEPVMRLEGEPIPVNLRPNEALATVNPIFFGARGWTFESPGNYQIMAACDMTLQDRRRVHSVSSPLALTVNSSERGPGRLLLKSTSAAFDAGKFLLWQGGDHLTNGQTHLLTLLERFPESTLADYTRFSFGKSLSRRFMDYPNHRVRPPDPVRAAVYLEQVRTNVLPDFLEIQRLLALVRCDVNSTNLSLAQRHLETAKRLIADRAEHRDFLIQVARFDKVINEAR